MATVQHPAFKSVTHDVDNPADWEAQGWTVLDAKEAEEARHESDPSVPVRPAGNASREEWADYASRQPAADADAIAAMSRDELRDTYSE